jgi:hypothetical protein
MTKSQSEPVLRFSCPLCRGFKFGGYPWRICNGHTKDGARCNFGFDAKDDWKYFTADGQRCESPEAYAAAADQRQVQLFSGEVHGHRSTFGIVW